jgi:RalA-binding protein 1
MSHHQRQEGSATQGTSRPSAPLGTSPTAALGIQSSRANSRGQTAQSPLSNTIIPRDYLASRSDVQPPRRAKPSPLQASFFPQPPPTAEASSMPPQSNTDTSQPAHDQETNSGGSGESTRPDRAGHLGDGQIYSSNISNGISSNGDIMKPVARVGSSAYREQMGQSPPDSPVSISSSIKSETTPSGLNMPRNSSIDSAISNVSSSANNPSKTSTNASQVTGAEIKNLIATAGSPENLIAYLLNEKQHAAAQNAQLWKLVEKQRSLLLGLNKDLEQLSKDKERYKKKLKELQTQAPSAPESSATGENATRERSPGNGSDKDSRTDYGLAMRMPEKSFATNTRSSPMDSAMLPPPLHTQQQQRPDNISCSDPPNSNASENTASMHQNIPEFRFTNSSNANAAATSANRQEENPVTSPVSSHEPSGRGAGLGGLQTTLKAPAVNLIEPSPLQDKSEKSFSSTKRTKPAPLNLNQSKRGSMMLLQSVQAEEHSDSEYEDHPDTGEQRGRRKTREEDDRERELAAKQESEARSRSKRGKSAQADQKSSVSETVLTVPPMPVNGLPLSPRPTTVQPTFAETNDRLIPPSAPYSTIQMGSQDSSTISQRHLTAPPKSPGLPMSPRPIDRPLGSPLPRMPKDNAGVINSLPLSPRMMPPGMPLSPRAPRQPLPPHTTSAAFPAPSGTMMSPTTTAHAGSLSQSNNTSASKDQNNAADTSPTSPDKVPQVFRGYVDLNYPNLLLPPNALPSVLVKVTSPRLRPSRMSYLSLKPHEEAPVFMLSVYSRFDGRELWRAEKVIMALTQLDHQFQAVGKTTARLPDRKLFSGHSPATVEARRAALNSYFGDLLDTPMNEKAALIICSFLSTDVLEPGNGETSGSAGAANGRSTITTGPDGRPRKEGYLTKRGKNFGGWKERFFVLHGPDLRYFESPGGAHLGSIKLQNAQIGKQSSSDSPGHSGDETESQYKHAFLILEPKRKDSSSLVRHILCAESNRERDEWVGALLHYVDELSEDESSAKGQTARADNEKSRAARLEAKVKQYASSMTGSGKDETMVDNPGTNALRSINYADTTHGPPPLKRTAGVDRPNDTPSPTSTSSTTTPHSMENDHQQGSTSSKAISNPTNGSVIQDAEAWGNKPAAASSFKENYHKKRGLWNFRQKSSTDLSAHEQDLNPNQAQQTTSTERQAPVRAVFGLPLAEAVELCPPTEGDINLPAVVYRCLEYLRAKNAASEEGIFRLSGSSVVIKALKERFNTEGDVNLLADGQYYDVHAVASLFKLYLRELPTTVLTRELHLEFLPITEINDKSDKIAAFNTLVHRLPAPNFSLLRALSQYLLEVINNSEQNKMGVRNVGIVFAPTLNIPAPVFAHFLNDFDAVFDAGVSSEGQTRSVEVNVPNTLAPVDIRSPRHQMFSDLPTPAYSQTSFAKGHAPSPFPAQSTVATQRAESPEDVGFIPMQPSYEPRQYPSNPYGRLQGQQRSPPMQQQPLSSQAEYGSLNMMMTPQNALTLKAKRRESSMLFMG